MSYRILIVEDSKDRYNWFRKELVGNDVVIATTALEAINRLWAEKFDFMFLDHDLADEHYEDSTCFEGTGSEIAKYLHDTPENNAGMVIIIHSLNSCGRERMEKFLESRNVFVFDFLLLKKDGLDKVIKFN
jgi:CheY-like chemotaxis protein